MRNTLTALVAAVVTVPAMTDAPAACAGAGPARRLDAVIDRWVGAGKVAGAVVLVAEDGAVVYRRAAGWADREAGRPVREDTIFRLASMSKLIVSAAALALADRGELSLDDPVSRWLPYFTPALADGRRPTITVRHLMTHTAGLSYSFLEPEGNVYQRERVPHGLEAPRGTLGDNLRRIAAVPLFYEPGAEWRYSVATDVLGGVVAAAAGMPLPLAVEKLVTGPLGMRDTAFHVVDATRLAVPYVDGDERAVRMDLHDQVIPLGIGIRLAPDRALDETAYPSGGAGMTGTAADYLALVEAVRTASTPAVSPAAARRLTTHAIGELRAWTEGPGWGFSLGAAVLLDPEAAGSPQSAGTWQWGGVLGTHWFVDPARALSVVVLTNTAVAGVIGPFPAAIRDAIYGT